MLLSNASSRFFGESLFACAMPFEASIEVWMTTYREQSNFNRHLKYSFLCILQMR